MVLFEIPRTSPFWRGVHNLRISGPLQGTERKRERLRDRETEGKGETEGEKEGEIGN